MFSYNLDEHKQYMDNRVSDTGSGEPLVYFYIYYVVSILKMYVVYVKCHNMFYFVNNGEYIPRLYILYRILLLFYDNKICLN